MFMYRTAKSLSTLFSSAYVSHGQKPDNRLKKREANMLGAWLLIPELASLFFLNITAAALPNHLSKRSKWVLLHSSYYVNIFPQGAKVKRSQVQFLESHNLNQNFLHLDGRTFFKKRKRIRPGVRTIESGPQHSGFEDKVWDTTSEGVRPPQYGK